jgi:hypothetical protein
MSKSEKVSVNKVLKLVEQLSPSQKGELRQKLEDSWSQRWDALIARVNKRNKRLPALTEDEIYAEFTEHRREQKAKRAQSHGR